ncbi:MAG TPA: flavodoxin domain-containing protein [Acetobacteraceae bacterium]|nr:flavodoxin domain-containing protein [Acetobacteraceae bacterium]
MPGLPMLPETAPFPAEQITALNRIMSATNAEQRTWLSGFLSGYQAANAPQPAAAAAPARRAPLTILFATESGNAESLADVARKAASKLGFAARVLDMADATPAQVAAAQNLLVIASTWGEGDPPQRAIDFHAALMAEDAPRFDGVRYAVLALGDRAYAKFCETGRLFDERFAALGGTRVADRIECDLDYDVAANAWLGGTLTQLQAGLGEPDAGAAVIHVDFARAPLEASAYNRTRPFEAEITERIKLSGSRSTSETWHVEVSLAGSGIVYEPGDSLGFLPSNDPALVDAVLMATGLSGDAALRAALSERFDITTLTRKQVADYARLIGDASLAEDVAFADGRQVIDLLSAAPHGLSAEQLTSLLRPLPPRYYSVASSLKTVPDEAHLLVAAVRYETHGRARSGVASVDLADRRNAGERLKVFVKPNLHFRLPTDPQRPIIMIGPGTGVAPFRAFMQERDAVGARGKSWLVFGHRHYTHDFLYQLEWQDLLKRGVLSRLDVAFSRDQPEKRYVQHALWDARRDLHAWVQDGAVIYVCGDANAMAKDVHATLQRIVGDQALDALRREGRYLRDVY